MNTHLFKPVYEIIVLMKQVANKDAVLRIGADEKWINETDVAQQTNESDGYALEEALRMKEARGEGEVVVCSLGPQSAKTVIKDALARGADRAIHVVAEDSKKFPFQIARRSRRHAVRTPTGFTACSDDSS